MTRNQAKFGSLLALPFLVTLLLTAAIPIPIGFFQSSGGGCSTISAAATTALNDWVTRVQAQGSDVTTPRTQAAVGCFIDGLMTDGTWTKLLRLNIYAGDSLAALKAPLKIVIGGTTDVLSNYVAGDYSQSIGLTGDGSTKFVDTTLAANTMSVNDLHISIYTRTGPDSGITCQVTDTGQATGLIISLSGTTTWDCNNPTTGRLNVTDTNGIGHYVGSRISSSDSQVYRNGISLGTNSNAGTTIAQWNFFIGARSSNGASFWTARTIEMYSIGDGLTAAQVASLTSRYATLRTALGR